MFFFFNDTATTEIYTLSLHDALPIWSDADGAFVAWTLAAAGSLYLGLPILAAVALRGVGGTIDAEWLADRKEHTSELQSRQYLVCRLLLEKKNSTTIPTISAFATLPL